MNSYFHYVPTEVLRDYLYPYLNFHERLSVNLCLPTAWRSCGQLDPTKIIQVGIKLATVPLSSGLRDVEGLTGIKRHDAIYKLISVTLPRNLIITQYNIKFRQVVLDRLRHFSDLENSDYNSCSHEFIVQMIGACAHVCALLKSDYPYLHEVNTCLEDSWSPVDGGPVVVVTDWGRASGVAVAKKQAYVKRRRGWGFAKSGSKEAW
jgi:hypothetical protein